MGRARLATFYHIIRKHPTGLCSICNALETVEHYLLHCKQHTNQRTNLMRAIHKQSLNISDLLANHKALDAVIAYVKETNKYHSI